MTIEDEKVLVLSVERDSVCAGDDCDAPHSKQFAFDQNVSLTEVVSSIVNSGYLAFVAGGNATWVFQVGEKRIAVIAQQWTSPKYLVNQSDLVKDCVSPENRHPFFFRYCGQTDPDIVLGRLKAELQI